MKATFSLRHPSLTFGRHFIGWGWAHGLWQIQVMRYCLNVSLPHKYHTTKLSLYVSHGDDVPLKSYCIKAGRRKRAWYPAAGMAVPRRRKLRIRSPFYRA